MAARSIVLLLVALAAVVAAEPIRETVSDCSAITDAFAALTDQYNSATKSSALSMTLTFNCTADWTGCTDQMSFVLSGPANTTNLKQPPIKITLRTRCKSGESVTIAGNPAQPFIRIDTSGTPAKVDVVLEKFSVSGAGLDFMAQNGSKSTLAVKEVSTAGAQANAVQAQDVERVTVYGGSFTGSISQVVTLTNILKTVSIKRATFDGYGAYAIFLDLPVNTRVNARGNTFRNANSPSSKAFMLTQMPGKINVNLAKTNADNSTMTTACIGASTNITLNDTATVRVTGSVGITPTKIDRTLLPAGWPVDRICNVAMFVPS